MDRFPRFRRHKKDVALPAAPATSTGAPPVVSADAKPSTRTPSPGSQALPLPPPPSRDKPSRSPFRGLHLRSSAKRARESPPGSLPQSPNTSFLIPDGHNGHIRSPLSAPLPTRRSTSNTVSTTSGGAAKIPPFLNLTNQNIEHKFHDIVWLERERMMEGHTNPSRDFRFARVPSDLPIRALDRYTNIQPWYNNRVRLRVPAGHVDYVNASPVALPSPDDGGPPDRYIAMQGPTRQSADHVWRMIVEQTQSPAVVVMLTETHEANMEKCFPYFPRDVGGAPFEVNERDEFGDGFRATVTCEAVEDTPAGEAIELRRLLVRVHKRRQPGSQTNGTNGANDANRTNGASDTLPATSLRDKPSSGDGSEHDVEMKSPVAKTDDGDVAMKSPIAKTDDGDVAMKSPTTALSASLGALLSAPAATTTAAAAADAGAAIEYEAEHTVYHFLYKKWPDFGVPALEDLESFFTLMRLSRERNSDPANPRIVHCSAGVGRSGTFIALEHLTRALDAGTLSPLQRGRGRARPNGAGAGADHDDGHAKWTDYHAGAGDEDDDGDVVFATVNALREQRRTMVQAEAQFRFIYRVLRKLWVDEYGDADAEGGSSSPAGGAGASEGASGGSEEPAAKRQEFDPFVV